MVRVAGGQESTDERLARELVAAQLGCAVSAHDDGSVDAMPDGRLTYQDGRTGWLEVVTDRDPRHEAQRDAVRRSAPLRVDGLEWSWAVYLHPDAQLKNIGQWLWPVLRHVEATAAVGSEAVNAMVRRRTQLVLRASSSPRPGGGTVTLFPRPGFASTQGHVELLEWLEDFLRLHEDIATKIVRAGPADERHAFIWATESSRAAWGTVSGMREKNVPLPEGRPLLPDGVTHLWVAGVANHDSCVAWFPDIGWHEVAAHWTRTPTGTEIVWGRLRADGRLAIPPDEL